MNTTVPVNSSVANQPWIDWLNKWFIWLMVAGILVNATGLFLPILEPDGALYATIAKNIAVTGDYINLTVEGIDWLDKPHFPFWVTAISFKLFGINSFAYKFPALLFWLAGAYYTYAFTNRLYNKPTAQVAVLIYLSVEHLIISNNDVRAEPYLTGLMIAAAYYYYLGYRQYKLKNFIAGSLFLAMAVMTKGIFIAVMVFAGFAIEWMIKKKWNEFLNYRWWLSAFMVLLFTMPELISLYIQFDMHPEKTVFGQKNVSGVRFFFWDSQFGRFFNTGPIKGTGSKLFYVHTLLWAFLPWSIILFTMVAWKIKNIKASIQPSGNYICEGIAFTGFVIFSFSSFQLPHYLNILYPFFSIIVAVWLLQLQPGVFEKTIRYSQNVLYFLFFVLCLGLAVIFGVPYLVPVIVALVITAAAIYRLFPAGSMQHIFARSFAAILIVNIFLNVVMYPELFRYQSGNAAAAFLKNQHYKGPVYMFNGMSSEYAFQFYYDQPVYKINMTEVDSLHNIMVYTPQLMIDSLQQAGYAVQPIQQFPDFPISQLTGKFINKHTRHRAVDYFILARVSKKPLSMSRELHRSFYGQWSIVNPEW